MSEEKKDQEQSAADLKQVPGGAPTQQKPGVPEEKDRKLSEAELEKVAGGRGYKHL